jgi:hypothetical protein
MKRPEAETYCKMSGFEIVSIDEDADGHNIISIGVRPAPLNLDARETNKSPNWRWLERLFTENRDLGQIIHLHNLDSGERTKLGAR